MIARRSLSVLKRGIEDRLFSGAGYALISKQAAGGVGTLGRVAFDGDECDRVDRDTLFDAASLTKPLATAMAALQLAGLGRLDLDTAVSSMLPEARQIGSATVRHLMTHTSGLPAIPPGSDEHPEQSVSLSLACASEAAPGSRYTYSDTGYILLGEIVARAAGVSLAEWYASRIAAPLHLADGGFVPDRSKRIVATAADASLDGLPHDPRARAMGGVSGHAGLFLSIADLAAYIRALLGAGKALMSPEMFELLFRPAIASKVGAQSLAFFCVGNAYLPEIEGFGPESVGHSGFTGCYILIDREARVAACLLTNRTLGSGSHSDFLEFRREWLAAAADDLLR